VNPFGVSSTAAVIPALDEAGNVAHVVRDVLGQGVGSVFVVDNGSADNTAKVAAEAGATVIVEPRRGYGYACLAGSLAAVDAGALILVYLDADGSSRADEVGGLLQPIVDGRADLVLGSRVLGRIDGGAMAPHQRLGNWIGARLMRRLYGLDVTDLGPYRAIRAEAFIGLNMSEMTFGWPTEMTVKCARSDLRIIEVPVTWQVRSAGRSKISGTVKGSVLAAYHIIATTIRYARR